MIDRQETLKTKLIGDRYELLRLIVEGGMGSVYEARSVSTFKRCALKLLSPAVISQNPEVVQRFFVEARTTALLESDHIVQVFDSGIDNPTGRPYLVMELLRGDDLRTTLARTGALEPICAGQLALQATLGLTRAHALGIFHRDIKPANLFLARRDSGEICVKLLDFGIAKVRAESGLFATETLTRTGGILGTPLYMSPEQIRGASEVDARSDVWSLGVVLFECLSGQVPFDAHGGSIGELMAAILTTNPKSLQQVAPWVPDELAAIVAQALERDPARRFSDASALGDALARALPGATVLESALVSASTRGRGRSSGEVRVSAATERSGDFSSVDFEPSSPLFGSPISPALGSPLRDDAHSSFPRPSPARQQGPSGGSPHADSPETAVIEPPARNADQSGEASPPQTSASPMGPVGLAAGKPGPTVEFAAPEAAAEPYNRTWLSGNPPPVHSSLRDPGPPSKTHWGIPSAFALGLVGAGVLTTFWMGSRSTGVTGGPLPYSAIPQTSVPAQPTELTQPTAQAPGVPDIQPEINSGPATSPAVEVEVPAGSQVYLDGQPAIIHNDGTRSFVSVAGSPDRELRVELRRAGQKLTRIVRIAAGAAEPRRLSWNVDLGSNRRSPGTSAPKPQPTPKPPASQGVFFDLEDEPPAAPSPRPGH